MKNLLLILSLFLGSILLSSCEKDYNEFYSDNRPDIPVTFPGTTTHGFNPYKTVSVADGNIEFTLAIPENSGRSITQISKVVAGPTAINAGQLRNSSIPNYVSAPINGAGNTIVFSTTIAEFASKSSANEDLAVSGGEIAFMFLVRLDNDQEIIPVQVRVRITD